jgi:hypothetical protein
MALAMRVAWALARSAMGPTYRSSMACSHKVSQRGKCALVNGSRACTRGTQLRFELITTPDPERARRSLHKITRDTLASLLRVTDWLCWVEGTATNMER